MVAPSPTVVVRAASLGLPPPGSAPHRPLRPAGPCAPPTPALPCATLAAMFIQPDLAEAVVGGLVGSADVDGGPSNEQWQIIGAITASLLARPDLAPPAIDPLGPDELAAALPTGEARHRFHELMVAVEACRHPLTDIQVARAEAYAAALGVEGPDLTLMRTFVNDGLDRAATDFSRFLDGNLAQRAEPQLATLPVIADRPEPALALRLEALTECPAGSLGQGLLAFYDRWGLPIPGREASGMNHFFVSHDMTHVIAGIEATAAGEIALSAMQMAMDPNSTNSSALLASLIVHEVGFGRAGKVAPEAGVLADPTAATLFGHSLARGAACTSDFSLVDHLALVDEPLAEVRGRFAVPPPADPNDGHHHW